MSEILLLRHGKSDWSVDVDDFNRPLTDRGKRAAQRIGCWLQSQGLTPNHVWSSPAKRAIETTEKTIKVVGMAVSEIQTNAKLYEATLTDLIAVIKEAQQLEGRVLIVGHNPSMDMVLETLVGEQLPECDDGKIMPTATLAHLLFDGDTVQLQQLIRPKTLPKLFPVPTPEGLTYAERPAYYYQQSGVLPYRFVQGELEVLLVTKSYKPKWGIPKGIIEPGYSAVDSAMKEAFEEAGIRGEVSLQSIGQYQHDKWGGTCDIRVYPMEVTEIVDDDHWESYKRQRDWFTIDQAKQMVENTDIRDMLKLLAKQLRPN